MGGREGSYEVCRVHVTSMSCPFQLRHNPRRGSSPFLDRRLRPPNPHIIHGHVLGAPSHPGLPRGNIWGDKWGVQG